MRASFFLTLAYLAASVWAGGYQGCLERLLLYHGYQIDGLNDPKDQTLGFRCKKWDSNAKNCKNNEWEACKGKGGGRCNFNELMYHLGKTPPNSKLVGPAGADQNTATPDIEETSKNVYKMFISQNGKVPNFPPYKAMKGADHNFNKYILRVGKVVNDARVHKTEANKHLWDGFESNLDKINIARAGDHGPYLIKAAEEKLGKPYGIEIKRMDLGDNPISNPKTKWETVDWKATSLAARAKGITNAGELIFNFRYNWYRSPAADDQAREHYMVFKSYKRVGDQIQSCRKT